VASGSRAGNLLRRAVVPTLALITAHGGTITQLVGADHPEITARFKDPAGNLFGLYQPR
jgi:predicted enzyme related to lactoylglutathione lyase